MRKNGPLSKAVRFSSLSRFQRLGDLVRAGGGLSAAADALQPLDGLVHRHAPQQAGDTLQVAVAAADHLDGLDDADLWAYIGWS